jgi:3-hydroxyacyl-CoA dehydrogenase
MNRFVTLARRDGVGVITIDNPPVNALSRAVAEEMGSCLEEAASDSEIRAVVLIGGGRTFVAGADINELEKAELPELHSLLSSCENLPKPLVMAIHGTALGGGLELAMAGHYRVAAAGAQVGQPEVNLGIIPGAEGTQRLPRLAGVARALEMCVTGAPISAQDAFAAGFIDRIVTGDLLEGAIAFAFEAAASGGPWPKTSARNEKLGTPDENVPLFATARQQASRVRRNQTAPLRAVEAIEAATTLPFAEGSLAERALFAECLGSAQARAMIHAFFAEREVARVPGIEKSTPVREIASVAIVGAGTMGGGIAMAFANAAVPVRITDNDLAALERGMATIRQNYENSVRKGRFSAEIMEQRMSLIRPQPGYDGFDEADLIVEAVFEDLALKKKIFSELDAVAKSSCILASNTSTLNIDELGACTSRPASVVGLHFFSPANVMRLVEIVRGHSTGADVIATALSLAKKLKKVGVVVGNCPGFVGNRMLLPYMREAQFLVEEGATPWQVDQALYDWGMAMGVFAVDDMAGIDVAWRVGQAHRHLRKPGERTPLVLDKLYHMGRLGQKAGRGWHRYDENRKPSPDPEVEALIEQTARDAGIERRAIGDQEIVERCIYALVNEGARILEEGFALRAGDIDTIYLTGYGFPIYRGGPMWYASEAGFAEVHRRICEFHQRHGELWRPAPLLTRLSNERKSQWPA